MTQPLRIFFVHGADFFLADARDSGRPDLLFHVAVKLFDNIQLLDFRGELADELHGQRIGQAQLQERSVLRKCVFGVLIGDRSGNHADFRAFQLHSVQRAGAAVLFEFFQVFLDLCAVAVRVCRRGNVSRGAADIGFCLRLLPRSERHKTLGVRDARHGSEQHGHVELFGDLVGSFHEINALLRVRRFDHGNLRVSRVPAVILLVLRRVHARVVGGDDYKAAVHAVISGCEHGIGCNVKSHMLHGAQTAHSGHRRSIGCFKSNFLIGCPLAVQRTGILRQIFKNLGARRSRIGRAHFHSRLVGAAGNCFISRQQTAFHTQIILS